MEGGGGGSRTDGWEGDSESAVIVGTWQCWNNLLIVAALIADIKCTHVLYCTLLSSFLHKAKFIYIFVRGF